MTAVASPPSVQPLPRWNSGDAVESLDSISAEEFSQILMPRKSAQRPNNSSSMSSNSSTSTSILSPPITTAEVNGDSHTTNGDAGIPVSRKKPARALWPSSKAEPVSAISAARPQGVPTPSSGQSASSTMASAINSNNSSLPPQPRPQSSQPNQNGSRAESAMSAGEATALLALLPMTGTFERKQINVPFFPDILRIGRQTNAKTIPTAVNGYFDSKVLSRQHAEVWADRSGKIWIRDVKSSNGTFVNGVRLSPENRESEPHELREHDTLELGIDIVSEDQKSIVHHKVSAKVELAGIYSNSRSMLDLVHGDSNSGPQYPGESIGPPMSQMRSRGNSNSITANNRLAGPPSLVASSSDIDGAQRQMNMWMGPITVEQVVRKLTTELKEAKQHFYDLDRTGEFFNTLMVLEPGQEIPKNSPEFAEEQVGEEMAPPPKDFTSPEAISPFSQPPAPPPQQPLPEKPDLSRSSHGEHSFKRTDTEKPRFFFNSPELVEPQNGQVESLLEALKAVTQESDSQGDRIKYLESALKRERRARELAERRASALSTGNVPPNELNEKEMNGDESLEIPLDSVELMNQQLPNGHISGDEDEILLKPSLSVETLKDSHEAPLQVEEEKEEPVSRLQNKLDLMVKEMSEMKILMESYKRRAEEAEEGRRSLAEMVENIRAGREPHSVPPAFDSQDPTLVGSEPSLSSSPTRNFPGDNADDRGIWKALRRRQMPNGDVAPHDMHDELERTFSNVLQKQRGLPIDQGRMAQSAPYVSMVGVVIIGVGIMTWLNGWQPGGER